MRVLMRSSLLFGMLVMLIAGCGGGGSSSTQPPQSKVATVKLSTSGTPSSPMSGISITVVLPDGVTPALQSDGSVAVNTVTVTGVAAPGLVTTDYTPATSSAKGSLHIALATTLTAGFGVGEFATISLKVAGANPVAGDFSLTDFSPIAITTFLPVTGLTPSVSSVVVQ